MARRRKSGFIRKIADYFTTAGLILIVALLAAYFGRLGETDHNGPFNVVDGDSLTASGVRYRLEGIDAPEYRQTCTRDGREWPCGREAARFLRRQMRIGFPICHGVGIDKYERILVQCKSGSTDINREMVVNGWAVSFGGFQREERLASKNHLGIWQGDFIRPRQWREIHGRVDANNDVNGLFERLIAKTRILISQINNWVKSEEK